MQNIEFMPDGQNRVFYMSGEWIYGVNCYLNLGNNPLQFPMTPLDIKGLNAPNNNTKTSQAPGDSAQGAFIGELSWYKFVATFNLHPEYRDWWAIWGEFVLWIRKCDISGFVAERTNHFKYYRCTSKS